MHIVCTSVLHCEILQSPVSLQFSNDLTKKPKLGKKNINFFFASSKVSKGILWPINKCLKHFMDHSKILDLLRPSPISPLLHS